MASTSCLTKEYFIPSSVIKVLSILLIAIGISLMIIGYGLFFKTGLAEDLWFFVPIGGFLLICGAVAQVALKMHDGPF